jgi:hypothetical protein
MPPLWEANKEMYLHAFSSLCLKMCECKRKTSNCKGEKTRTKLQNLLEKTEALGMQQTCLKYRSWDILGCCAALGCNFLQTFRCTIKSLLQVLKKVPRIYLCPRIIAKWKAVKSKGDQTVFISSEENDLLARLVHRIRISRFHTFSTRPFAVYSLFQQKVFSWPKYGKEKIQSWLLLCALMRSANDTGEGTYVIQKRTQNFKCCPYKEAFKKWVLVSYFVDTTAWNSSQFGHWIQCIKCSMIPSTIRRHKRLWKIHLWKIHARKISGIERTVHW